MLKFSSTTHCLLAAAIMIASCSDDDDGPEAVLIVQAAQRQPSKDEAGIIVAIQSVGGAWLEIAVSDGALDGPACVPAPTGSKLIDNVLNVLIRPVQTEAVVTVKLFPDVARETIDVAEQDSGGSGGTGGLGGASPNPPAPVLELGPCGIASQPLKQRIVPIQRVNAVSPAPSTGGAGGLGGSGGSAGSGGTGGSGGEPPIGGQGGTGGEPPIGGQGGDAGAAGMTAGAGG